MSKWSVTCPRCGYHTSWEDVVCSNCYKGHYSATKFSGDTKVYFRCDHCGDSTSLISCPECDANWKYQIQVDKIEGDCYIATAIYGSYSADEVIVLRNFRDSYLLKRVWGRMLVNLYCKYSPSLVIKLRNKKLLNKAIRKALDKLVLTLKKFKP